MEGNRSFIQDPLDIIGLIEDKLFCSLFYYNNLITLKKNKKKNIYLLFRSFKKKLRGINKTL